MPARRSARATHKREALQTHGTLHPRPQDVTDPLFHQSVFFDADDIVQVKYEMLRRVRIDEHLVSETAAAFGFSRPSFYTARTAFEREGLVGLLPRKRGPRHAHKLTDAVLAVLAAARTADGDVPSITALVRLLAAQFGIAAHPRSVARSLRRYAKHQEKKRLSRRA